MSQIFKSPVPSEQLFELLNKIAVKTDKCYVLDNIAFKKGIYNDWIAKFVHDCIPYYHCYKRQYLTKKLTYNSFITIVRQICKFNNIHYTTQIKYDKSDYDIVYFLFFPKVEDL